MRCPRQGIGGMKGLEWEGAWGPMAQREAGVVGRAGGQRGRRVALVGILALSQSDKGPVDGVTGSDLDPGCCVGNGPKRGAGLGDQ